MTTYDYINITSLIAISVPLNGFVNNLLV